MGKEKEPSSTGCGGTPPNSGKHTNHRGGPGRDGQSRRAPVLQAHGRPGGTQRLSVPRARGLTLICYSDRNDLVRAAMFFAVRGQCQCGGFPGGVPHFTQVVLNPAFLREMLGELLIALGGNQSELGHQ